MTPLAHILHLARARGWPLVLYRSPVMNERYVIPAGRVFWETWAAEPPLACDLPRVLAVLELLPVVALAGERGRGRE